MPARLDFVCACGSILRNRVAPAGAPCPDCVACGRTMEVLWQGRSPSVGFTSHVEFEDDDGSRREFQSVEEIRRFEAQAEREVASGDRARPVVFREFSQDSSNRDVNVFQDRHPQVARDKLKAAAHRRGKKIIDVGAVDISVAERMAEGGEG